MILQNNQVRNSKDIHSIKKHINEIQTTTKTSNLSTDTTARPATSSQHKNSNKHPKKKQFNTYIDEIHYMPKKIEMGQRSKSALIYRHPKNENFESFMRNSVSYHTDTKVALGDKLDLKTTDAKQGKPANQYKMDSSSSNEHRHSKDYKNYNQLLSDIKKSDSRDSIISIAGSHVSNSKQNPNVSINPIVSIKKSSNNLKPTTQVIVLLTK